MLARWVRNAVCLLSSLAAASAVAAEFRIESRIYQGKEKQPASRSLTLFHAGVIYDYLDEPKRVAVLDPKFGRFILLDPQRRLRAEIKTAEVRTFSTGLKDLLAKSGSAQARFQAQPVFAVDWNEPSGTLNLTSDSMSYKVEALPAPTADVAQQYREFCDWCAQLNSLLSPAGNPPFARFALDEELAARGLVPKRVALQIGGMLGSPGLKMHSEHEFAWRLLDSDRRKIDETGQQLSTFEPTNVSGFADVAAKK